MTDANQPSGVDVEYEPERDRYAGSFDTSETEPSMAVVEAIADVTHSDPMDLAPLHRSVETDALDSLVSDADDPTLSVSFEVEEFTVTVHGDGTIEIRPPERAFE